MLSFVEVRDRIFERWLSEVERLLDRHLDRDVAFAAWTKAEYAAGLKARRTVWSPRKAILGQAEMMSAARSRQWPTPSADERLYAGIGR
jgi:hypothetical protein